MRSHYGQHIISGCYYDRSITGDLLDEALSMISDHIRSPDIFPGFSFVAGTAPAEIPSFLRGQSEVGSLNSDLTAVIIRHRHTVLSVVRDVYETRPE